jgi:2-polyprenyl-6-methoxyphenol hydroxylase-like FAD-dependent oxidoreductase
VTTSVAIVGGGIGGIALALSLVDAGISALDIYESTPSSLMLGVGVNLQPNAVRELAELGLLDALYQVAITTAEVVHL